MKTLTIKSAREIVAKGYDPTGIPSSETVQQNWNFRYASGFLKCAEQAEKMVKAFMESADSHLSWCEFITDSLPESECNCGIHERKKALAIWREMQGK